MFKQIDKNEYNLHYCIQKLYICEIIHEKNMEMFMNDYLDIDCGDALIFNAIDYISDMYDVRVKWGENDYESSLVFIYESCIDQYYSMLEKIKTANTSLYEDCIRESDRLFKNLNTDAYVMVRGKSKSKKRLLVSFNYNDIYMCEGDMFRAMVELMDFYTKASAVLEKEVSKTICSAA